MNSAITAESSSSDAARPSGPPARAASSVCEQEGKGSAAEMRRGARQRRSRAEHRVLGGAVVDYGGGRAASLQVAGART